MLIAAWNKELACQRCRHVLGMRQMCCNPLKISFHIANGKHCHLQPSQSLQIHWQYRSSLVTHMSKNFRQKFCEPRWMPQHLHLPQACKTWDRFTCLLEKLTILCDAMQSLSMAGVCWKLTSGTCFSPACASTGSMWSYLTYVVLNLMKLKTQIPCVIHYWCKLNL